jgi:hypothetical protein
VRTHTPRTAVVVATALAALLTLPAFADEPDEPDATIVGDVTPLAHFPGIGGSEVDSDGERYLFAGQANLDDSLSRQNVEEGQHGGLRIIDLETMTQVGALDCPGTDNYVRYLDPEVYNTAEGDREFVVMAHHGNVCTAEALAEDPNTRPGYGAFNGIMIVDVTDKTAPTIAGTVGADSAHTVMPHPTEPYLYVLPGGLANGTNVPNQSVSPTAIIDVSDPTDPIYVSKFTHNAQGCHDLGFSHDGDYAFCAGFGEVQVWDIAGDRVTAPQVTGTIVNPAIQFAHNAVVSPSGRYLAINDEAFGFHTCSGEAADLYGSLWIYDISVPEVPVLAGRVSPPGHPDDQGFGTLDDVGPINGWADSWCAAHNYNWVPGNDDVIVASWFAGGVTAHDISDLMAPELIAHYMPADGVAWSGHYYAGYLVTNDMVRGVEVLDAPDVRAADPTWTEPEASHPGKGNGKGKDKGKDRPGKGESDAPGGDQQPGGEQTGTLSADRAFASASTTLASATLPPIDRSAELLPAVLPPRPFAPREPGFGSGFCVLPGRTS